MVKEVLATQCDWEREAEAHCAGLRSGPAFG
jgi:hypothetical protein